MPAAENSLWEEYLRTRVELVLSDGAVLRIIPAPPSQVGQWPQQLTPPLYFLTAWDPGDERPSPEINRAQQLALEQDLARLGALTWPSSGTDALTGHREEGVAITGMDEGAVRALGQRYGQNAIFSWTPESWAVVSCDGSFRTALGWRLSRP
jgi:hypothetical protein